MQFLADSSEYKSSDNELCFTDINSLIHRGDIIGAIGFVGKSLKGELSIYPTSLMILTPCFEKYIPKQIYGITDIETRIKNRHLGKNFVSWKYYSNYKQT